MKRYIYIGNFRFPDRNAAGKRVFGNCLLLQSLGYDVVCIGHGKGDDLLHNGVLCHTIKTTNFDRVTQNNAWKIKAILEDYMHNGGISGVFFYGALFTQRENFELTKWCKKRNIAVFYDRVDWFEFNWRYPHRSIIRLINHTILDKKVIPLCNGVVCISKFFAEYYEKKGKTTVIIPPLSVNKRIEKRSSRESDKIRFIYSGTPLNTTSHPKQWKDRLDIMFEQLAMAAKVPGLRPFSFDVYGLTREQYICMFPKFMRKNGQNVLDSLGDCVTFWGHAPNELVMQQVEHADFTVLIRDKKRSTMAGFPTKVSESISCGTPVICTDTSDLEEYIHNGQNGLICGKEGLSDVFVQILMCSDDELDQLKEKCKTDLFSYILYQDKMRGFIEKTER